MPYLLTEKLYRFISKQVNILLVKHTNLTFISDITVAGTTETPSEASGPPGTNTKKLFLLQTVNYSKILL